MRMHHRTLQPGDAKRLAGGLKPQVRGVEILAVVLVVSRTKNTGVGQPAKGENCARP